MPAMDPGKFFIVAVASGEKGVGKTTLATNLCVYLKALEEDLPVTFASLDPKVDAMEIFGIPGAPDPDTPGGAPGPPLGEYGVQYLPSAEALLDGRSPSLLQALSFQKARGVVILDTPAPLNDLHFENLAGCDLVLFPVCGRSSWRYASEMARRLQEKSEESGSLWVVPALIKTEERLHENIAMAEYVSFSARERGYQVVDLVLPLSPGIDRLQAFSARHFSVLTRAPSSPLHPSLRALADFVLERYHARGPSGTERARRSRPQESNGCLVQRGCPLCEETVSGGGHFFQDLRSRRVGLIHSECLEDFLHLLGLEGGDADGLLLLKTLGAGFAGPHAESSCFLFDSRGELCDQSRVESIEGDSCIGRVVERAAERSLHECLKEHLLVALGVKAWEVWISQDERRRFASLRKKALRLTASA